MKLISHIFFILLILLLMGVAFVEVSYSKDNRVCFSVEDSKRLVVELEKGKIIEKNLGLLEKSNIELSKQIDLLKLEVSLVNDKFLTSEKLLKTNEDLYKKKEKVLNDELNEAKKTRWGSLFASGGLGVIITLVLCIAL